jgi:hypothetical protein
VEEWRQAATDGPGRAGKEDSITHHPSSFVFARQLAHQPILSIHMGKLIVVGQASRRWRPTRVGRAQIFLGHFMM